MGNIKHSKAKPQFSILILITTIVFLLQFSKASASEYDICVNVLEEITNPVNEYNCWKPLIKKKILGIQIWIPNPKCAFVPHCCMPGLCKVSPDCGLAKVTYETIASAGDVHCFENITASDLFDRWINRQIAIGADILVGGLLSEIYPIVLDNIDSVALMGTKLPRHVQDLLKEIIRPVYSSGMSGYTYDNVSDVKIINENKNFLTKFWMQKGAITLGPVVVLADDDYNQLMDPASKVDLYNLLLGQNSSDFSSALSTIIHELVHFNQYSEQGREVFITNYLLKNAPLVSDGYGFCEFEQEAYGFEAFIAEFLGGKYCNDVKYDIDGKIDEYLNRPHILCRRLEDTDGDQHYNHLDNCPFSANPEQADINENGVGDVCDFQAWLPALLYLLH